MLLLYTITILLGHIALEVQFSVHSSLTETGLRVFVFYEDVLKIAVEMTPRISLLFARKEARHHGTIKTKDFS